MVTICVWVYFHDELLVSRRPLRVYIPKSRRDFRGSRVRPPSLRHGLHPGRWEAHEMHCYVAVAIYGIFKVSTIPFTC